MMSKAEERMLEHFPNEDKDSLKGRFGFLIGYLQAEKDLSDISWIKEVSGVKEISRAKEEALKAYPPQSIAANYDTINRRDAFEYGYLKAEKDLELSWEDIPKIFQISEELKTSWWFRDNEQTKLIGTQPFWEEVLKKFKENIY